MWGHLLFGGNAEALHFDRLLYRHGVNRAAQVLRLEYGGLRKRVENQARPKAKNKNKKPTSFLEFIAPGAKPVSNCTVEVESAQGSKLRLELKAVATSEFAAAAKVTGPHTTLKHGDQCPACREGKIYEQTQPATLGEFSAVMRKLADFGPRGAVSGA